MGSKDEIEKDAEGNLDDFMGEEDGLAGLEAEESAPETDDSDEAEEGEEVAASPAEPKAETKTKTDDDVWADPTGEVIPRKAFVATRNKWREKAQEAERRAAELEARLSAPPQRQETAPAAPVAPADPDLKFYELGPGKALRAEADAVRQENRTQVIESERRTARRTVADYQDAEKAFIEAARNNRALAIAFNESDDPVGLVLEQGRQILERQKRGTKTEADLRAEIRAEIEAELRAETGGEEKEAEGEEEQPRKQPARKPPKSLAGARNAGNSAREPEGDDDDVLDELFPR